MNQQTPPHQHFQIFDEVRGEYVNEDGLTKNEFDLLIFDLEADLAAVKLAKAGYRPRHAKETNKLKSVSKELRAKAKKQKRKRGGPR